MREFFDDLVSVKDALQPQIVQPACESEEDSSQELDEYFHTTEASMAYYYTHNIERYKPTIPSLPWHPQSELMTKLKFQTVVLSMVDIHTIVQTVTSHKARFLSANYNTISKMAEKAKIALAEDLSLISISPGSQLQYLMFIQEFKPRDMEDNYITQLHVSRIPSTREERSLASRVKDVTRRMLLAVDSFAAFVSRSATCSLADMVEFIIDFSYMYKHSTDKKGVQLELLARFLKAHLDHLPDEYRMGNFRKLFNELFLDYKRKHILKRTSAERNLQMLLMASHMMEKHLSDIRSEEKLITAFKRSNDFFSFILKERIPVTIKRAKSPEGANLLQVARATTVRMSRVFDLTTTHVTTVLDFAREFCTYEEAQRATEFEEDVGNAREAFSQYLLIVREKLEEHPQYSHRTPEEVDFVFEDIAKYMTRRMNKELFPPWASKADLRFTQRCEDLAWVMPEDLRLDLTEPNLMVQEAIQDLKDTDNFLSPQSKLAKMVEAVSLLLNEAEFGVTLDNLERPESALPYLMYLLIKTHPARFWSNMNFIAKFWHPRQTEKQPWLCFSMLKSAARLIDAADAATFHMKAEAFERKIGEARNNRN